MERKTQREVIREGFRGGTRRGKKENACKSVCTHTHNILYTSPAWTDHQLHVYRPSLPSSGELQHFSGTKKKPKTKWASLFHGTLFFLFPLFWQECWLKQPLQSVQTQYDSRHLRNALLAFTPRHIQKVLGWFWTQRIHTVMLLYSHFRWTTDKQCACLCVSVCVCVCVCVILCMKMIVGIIAFLCSYCHQVTMWINMTRVTYNLHIEIPNPYSAPPENRPTHPHSHRSS